MAKIADDLYCGGNTPEELIANWTRVLQALHKNNLRLSARKTIIAPRSTTILGWLWSAGRLQASPHRIAALASVPPPKTVQGLRSFIGAYKVLSRVLPGYALMLDPLDQASAGKQSRDIITWTDDLHDAFKKAQEALSSSKTITMPRPDDTLWVVSDGSVKNRGIASTLFVLREDQLLLAGYFSAKLRKHQVTWLPCEIEALSIGSAIRHFAPYIMQSKMRTQVLTDSRPCVQAYNKLIRGEFSASARVTTFLSVLSRYRVQLQHISGAANLPADYASRNPQACSDQSCQVCQFIADTEDSVVRATSVQDVLDGTVRMPFTNRSAWLATQQDCPDLRRVHSHLVQGTRPSKKMTRIPDVKRYLRDVTVASDGLLIVREARPFQPTRERIVIPRAVLNGLLTATHLRFNHPSAYQMKQLVSRYFFALDLDRSIQDVCSACHHCTSLKSIPQSLQLQSSTEPPDHIGCSFAADVMRRYRQCILVLRETVSSFTLTSILPSEKHDVLRDAIITMCASILPTGHDIVHIRVDPAPGFVALTSDSTLKKLGIVIDVGRVKNVNKNPVAERAVEELGLECLRLSPEGIPLTPVTLALATAQMNSRIRKEGLSAWEVWTQRDQVTGEQLPIEDRQLILCQHHTRNQNHAASATSKAHGKTTSGAVPIQVGDLVYLKGERDKTKARDKYLVVSVCDQDCRIRKFTQSQYRAKSYDVKLTDCYLAASTVLSQWPPGPVRGLEYPEVDPDSTHEIPPTLHSHPALPTPPLLSNPPRSSRPQQVFTQTSLHQPGLTSVPAVSYPLDTSSLHELQPPDPPAAIIDLPNTPTSSTTRPNTSNTLAPIATQPNTSSTNAFDTPSDNLDLQASTSPPRRSSRSRKPPAWQQSDLWEL